MEDIENPYRSPDDDELAPIPASDDQTEDPRKIGKAKSVPTVANLMIIHGVLMFIAACSLFGILFSKLPEIAEQIARQQQMQRQQNPNAPQLSKDNMTAILYATYAGIAVALIIIGVVGVLAGIQNRNYGGRVFGVISLILNMGSILFCWCLPFSLGLLIYGLIIYLSPDSERAFNWRTSHPRA